MASEMSLRKLLEARSCGYELQDYELTRAAFEGLAPMADEQLLRASEVYARRDHLTGWHSPLSTTA